MTDQDRVIADLTQQLATTSQQLAELTAQALMMSTIQNALLQDLAERFPAAASDVIENAKEAARRLHPSVQALFAVLDAPPRPGRPIGFAPKVIDGGLTDS